MIDTPPLATPRLTEALAPNSSDTSSNSIPSAPRETPKNPPPVNRSTASKKGFSRVQKPTRKRTGELSKGMFSLPDRARLESENTPAETLGRATE